MLILIVFAVAVFLGFNIANTFDIPVVIGVYLVYIIRWLAKYSFRLICLQSKSYDAGEYASYVQQKFDVEIIRLIFPKAGWYLYTQIGLNPKIYIRGPFVTDHPIRSRIALALSIAPSSTNMSAWGKFHLRPPEGARPSDNEDYFMIGYP